MKTEPADVQAWAEKNGVQPYLAGPPCNSSSAQQMFCTYADVDIGALSPARVMFEFNTHPAGISPTLMAIYVRFSSDDYTKVLNAITAKYGPPDSVEHPTVMNGLGNTFSNEVVTWKSIEGTLVLQRFKTSIAEGRLAYMAPVIKEREDRGGYAGKL
jgi:hypothetical protein